MYVAFLNLEIKVCSKVFELSFSSSKVYKYLENDDVAIIDRAVIVKPVVIERNDDIVSNAVEFLKSHFVENKYNSNTLTITDPSVLIVFILNFAY